MKKNCLFLLVFVLLLTPLCNSTAESDVPEIILESGFYYVVQPNGEKVAIVKEHEPWAPNKVKLSPNQKYIVYTTANCLGFECEGRDLFCCKTDGTKRTFLHKIPSFVQDWVWVTKGNRNFLIVTWGGNTTWVLDVEEKKLLLSFSGHTVERIQGTDCYKLVGVRKERKICPDELLRIMPQETPKPQVIVDWSRTQVYLSSEREPILGYKEILCAFAAAYQVLSPEERQLYKESLESLAAGGALFSADNATTEENIIPFFVNSMGGKFNLQKRKIEFLDIGGKLALKVFRSSSDNYFAILKTKPTGSKELTVWNMIGYAAWTRVFTKQFSSDATISNLEWSEEDETKIYYTLREAEVSKDNCLIDLTEESKE